MLSKFCYDKQIMIYFMSLLFLFLNWARRVPLGPSRTPSGHQKFPREVLGPTAGSEKKEVE